MELTPDEWAAWALPGEPYARVPPTLKELHRRVADAIISASIQASMARKRLADNKSASLMEVSRAAQKPEPGATRAVVAKGQQPVK